MAVVSTRSGRFGDRLAVVAVIIVTLIFLSKGSLVSTSFA